ncbi:phage replisome organizer N-terminal domain-containing protein [Veillonella parvula]|uniref:phage replisome organizer N-terminal domain-containing protein n=1 Tax=Veillonella parvula TaxID=29466 RepID=UPI002911FE08|nr:phage replisome organizer N-terminal domain-containing protein [Veillonella parvula]MDU4110733.1 phage replisome organizer N-terminal domain-containing protein [Veillonella parvula]MDU4140162.1 phage replisome organizer N-terminal domain-containing protein [Veillonella parvula]
MSDNKKYYYLRLKDNFFDSDELKILESMKDGYLYSNILLKLYLRSLKNDGKLVVNDRIPYNTEMLASVTGHQVGTIKQALSMFKELGLIEVLENGAIYMLDIQNFIGKGSTEADRQRLYDRRISEERKQKKITQSRNLEEILEKSTPEIEIEKELELEIEKDSSAKSTTTKRKRFEKPSISDIKQYCMERNNNIIAEQFYDYYESNGWKVGKNSMKDWKAAVRTWERSEYRKPNSKKNSKEDAINVVKELMEEYEQSATDSESTINVTDSVQY